MPALVGGNPGAVYTEDDQVKGKCPIAGTKAEMIDSQGSKEFILCKVAASQNLVNGNVVTVAANFVVTAAPVSGPAVHAMNRVAVAVVSITASASTLIWCQVYGRSNVMIGSASVSINAPLRVFTTAGQLEEATGSASGYIEGIVLLATGNTAASLASCFLDYPRYGGVVIGA